MWNHVRRWLDDVPLREPIERQQAFTLQIMLITMIVVAVLDVPINLFTPFEDRPPLPALLPILLAIAVISGALALIRFGYFRASVLVVMIGLLVASTLLLAPRGLAGGGALLPFVLPVTLAGLLSNRRTLLLASASSVAIVVIINFLEHLSPQLAGFDPYQGDVGNDIISNFIPTFVLLVLCIDRFGTSLRNALHAAFAREQELIHSRAVLEARTDELSLANAELEREIGERKRVEAALRESEERYRLITENSSDLISLIDLTNDGRRIYASPSYRTVLGYDPDTLVGVSGNDLVHPDDWGHVAEQFARVLDGNVAQATYRLRDTGGSWCWIETRAVAIPQQGYRYAVTTGRDVTERVRLEEQVQQAQKMESIGRLAGGVAHDFNNLLTVIMGNLDLVLDTLPGNHILHSDLAEARKAADRAATLTRQLLAFARKQPIEPRVINMNDLIAEMGRLLRRLIGEDIELITLPAPYVAPIKADPSQIEQVIVNLAVNARDAMPEGGKLTIEIGHVEIDQSYVQQHVDVTLGTYVLLAISDTGVGMDAETLRQIFEPFFTTKPKGRSTGLGLATCYGIIKQHGGHIWPYSEPGHGSTFRIYLPLADEAVAAPAGRRDPDELPYGTETVLLAEDEDALRALAARVLRERGYTVLEARDGDEALQLARGHDAAPIDLLLTDVVMPRMSGKALAQQVGAIYSGIKVLYISGYADHAVIHHGRLDPDVDFLHKPFSPSTLARKVRQVLDAPDAPQS